MPGYKTHVLGGLVSFSFVAAVYQQTGYPITIHPAPFAIGFILSMIGSIFPDIDTASVMQRLFYSAMAITLLIGLVTRHIHFFIAGGLLCIGIAFLRHRTITHNPLFLILIPLVPAAYVTDQDAAKLLYTFFTCSTLSHLALDFYLPKRLLPFKRK